MGRAVLAAVGLVPQGAAVRVGGLDHGVERALAEGEVQPVLGAACVGALAIARHGHAALVHAAYRGRQPQGEVQASPPLDTPQHADVLTLRRERPRVVGVGGLRPRGVVQTAALGAQGRVLQPREQQVVADVLGEVTRLAPLAASGAPRDDTGAEDRVLPAQDVGRLPVPHRAQRRGVVGEADPAGRVLVEPARDARHDGLQRVGALAPVDADVGGEVVEVADHSVASFRRADGCWGEPCCPPRRQRARRGRLATAHGSTSTNRRIRPRAGRAPCS